MERNHDYLTGLIQACSTLKSLTFITTRDEPHVSLAKLQFSIVFQNHSLQRLTLGNLEIQDETSFGFIHELHAMETLVLHCGMLYNLEKDSEPRLNVNLYSLISLSLR